MENSLKQRIIGAIVLAALAIIFLPAILKEKASNGTFESKIPEKPQVLEEYRVDTDKIERLKRAKELEQSAKQQQVAENSEQSSQSNQGSTQVADSATKPAKDSEQSKSRKSKVTTAAPDKTQPGTNETVNAEPDITAKPSPETLTPKFKSAAWVVQVASFSNESNAINLVEKLKAEQFKAYRRKSLADGKTVYRVYVGPYIDKPKAQAATGAISKVSETKVVLRVFDPVKH